MKKWKIAVLTVLVVLFVVNLCWWQAWRNWRIEEELLCSQYENKLLEKFQEGREDGYTIGYQEALDRKVVLHSPTMVITKEENRGIFLIASILPTRVWYLLSLNGMEK